MPRLSRALPLLILAACGGGGGGSATTMAPVAPLTPVVPTTYSVNVSKASGNVEARLACYHAGAPALCQLRTYQVMVESFVDADTAANFNAGYGPSPHRGDLQGIINSLDYIKGTGVNALWLTPIFLSASRAGQDLAADRLDATGYFATDYFKVDPRFGTLAQARTLVDEAHKRGLYVFFDGVFGHHKDTGVAPSPTGLLPAGGHDPVDYSQGATLAFYQEVASYWVTELKIDGWRLDQAYQVPTSAWSAIRASVEQASAQVSYTNAAGASVPPLAYMVAELWKGESEIASTAYGSTSAPVLASAFDFPMRYRLVRTLASDEDGFANQGASYLASGWGGQLAYPDHAAPNLMLGNHDLPRFGDLVQRAGLGNPDGVDYWARHKMAFTFMAAYSGPVTIYYGEEIGQEMPNFAARVTGNCVGQGLCDDHVSRDAGVVDGVAGPALSANQRELKNHVAKLLALRTANPALATGSRTHVFDDNVIYIDRKDSGSNHVLLVMNVKAQPAVVTLDAAVAGGAASLHDLASDADVAADAKGQFTINLPALSARLLRF